MTGPRRVFRSLAQLLVFGCLGLLSGCSPSPIQLPSPTPTATVPPLILCSNHLPESECAALFELIGREIPAPCDKVGHISCVKGHITRVDFRWAHAYGYSVTGIPDSIKDFPYLTQLRLFGNRYLTGSLPPGLFTLKNLAVLDVGDTQLSGHIPPALATLPRLRYLNLDANELTGEIPPELGELSNLEYLHLFGNQLTGGIPPELGDLSALQELHLGHNQLTGSIPAELGNLSQLQRLYLHDNRLSGPIPPELGSLNQLEDLYLRQNQLTGTIPPEVAQLEHLLRFDISFNLIQGDLPDDLSDTLLVFWFHQTQLSEPESTAWQERIPYTSAVVRYENFDCASVTTLPREECEALLAIYLPLDDNLYYYSGMWGTPYTVRLGAPYDWLLIRENWSGDYPLFIHNDPCRWFTVTCQDGHVQRLYLGYEPLPESYQLPPAIVDLAYVESIDIVRGTPICYDANSGVADWLHQLDYYLPDMIQPCEE